MPQTSRLLGLFLAALITTSLPAYAGSPIACLANAQPQSAIVKSITDGDTIKLSDGRKVRVLGFNTPELRPKPEPGAVAATEAAKALLPTGTKVFIYPGIEAEDRYGRVLAHVTTIDGKSLGEYLLTRGLAASSAVHPNTRCADHYQQLEQTARSKKLGLWAQPHPWQLVDKRLNKNRSGFRLVTSTVKSIKINGKTHNLLLNNGLRVSIRNALAKQINANQLIGKRITVRGWMQWRKNKASVRLHHASNLQIL